MVNARGTMGDAPCVSGFCEDFEDAPGRPRGASLMFECLCLLQNISSALRAICFCFLGSYPSPVPTTTLPVTECVKCQIAPSWSLSLKIIVMILSEDTS